MVGGGLVVGVVVAVEAADRPVPDLVTNLADRARSTVGVVVGAVLALALAAIATSL